MTKDRDDIDLIREFKSGNKVVYNEIVRKYEKRLYLVIKRMVNDHDDTNDIMQEVFIKAYDSLDSFREESNLYTWLYRISVNFAINFLNKKKLRQFFHYDELIMPLISGDLKPDERMEKAEQSNKIQKAIDTLPQMQRLTFVMRYYDELSYEEISKILKKSVGTLKANYFHAFKKIEEYLKNEV
jgi:RNA polymerase sigma-70 factor (ECF subfamily)